MSRLIMALCIVLIALQTSFTRAQTETASYSLSTGFAIPSAPDGFTDNWNTGYNLSFGMGYPLSPRTAFLGCVDYSSFSFDKDGFLSSYGLDHFAISIDGGNASIVTASANLKAVISPRGSFVSSYFIGGLGFFRLSFGDVTINYIDSSEAYYGNSETAISNFFGAGVDFTVNDRVAFFVEAKYGVGFTEFKSTHYFPIKFGFSFK